MDPRQINPDGSIGIKRKAPNFRETLNSGNRKPYLPLFSFPPFLLPFFLSVLDAETWWHTATTIGEIFRIKKVEAKDPLLPPPPVY